MMSAPEAAASLAGRAVLGPGRAECPADGPRLYRPPVYRPAAAAVDRVRSNLTTGAGARTRVPWFGITSFWGHLRHFIASAIATEDVDSRDWMTPDDPAALADAIAEHLGAPARGASLVEAVGRDVWIDWIADTGDDQDVSRAVAAMVFSEYSLPDPDREGADLDAPRGDLLLFGGDTAYPVATVSEIHNRVIVPFNSVLHERNDGRARVLLGIPGNHDWYDGLDGFARMFRRKLAPKDDHELEASLEPHEDGRFGRAVAWADRFVQGGQVQKPKALVLEGYTAVQSASFFLLPLTRTLPLFGVDRQLKSVDLRQRRFFKAWWRRNPGVTPMVALHEPVHAFGAAEPHPHTPIASLELDLEHDDHLVIAGDIHHYERFRRGRTLHVTAGGGGAFLHPAPLAAGRRLLPFDREWPGPRQSSALLSSVPWHVAAGRAGFLPHLILLALFAPPLGLGAGWVGTEAAVGTASVVAGGLSAVVFALLGGIQKGRAVGIGLLAGGAGVVTGLVPMITSLALLKAFDLGSLPTTPLLFGATSLVLAVVFGALVFGAFLAALTRLGYDHYEAFTALGHPGYKHFVRLRVRADGAGVDAWCLGLEDPLAPGERPVLVDAFSWRPVR